MRHLGRADAERVGAERAVGRGVAVAADDQQARQGQALLRPDHMHDALARIVEAEQLDAMLGGILLDLAHHPRQLGIGDVGAASRASARSGRRRRRSGPARRPARRAPPAGRRRGTSPHARSGGRPRAATAPSSRRTISWAAQSLSIRVSACHGVINRRAALCHCWRDNIEGAAPNLNVSRFGATSRGGTNVSSDFAAVNRRRFLQSTAGAARPPAFLHAPAVLRAQGAPRSKSACCIRSRARCRTPASRAASARRLAIEEINAAGGIKALGGAKIEPVLGDAQSTPEGGNAEVEKMNGAGVAAVVGGYASGICLAASQTAARYDLPYIVDVGVVDSIVTPRPEEHVPLRAGLRRHRQDRDRQSRHHQRAGRQAGEDRDDRARGLGVRRGPRQAPEHAIARARLPGAGNHRASDADARLQQRRAQDQGAEPGSRHSRRTTTTNTCCSPAPCSSSAFGRRASIRCSAAPRRPTSSSRNSRRPRNTSWTAITGSIRRIRRRWR